MSPGGHSYQASKMSLDSHSCWAEEVGGLSSAGRGGPSTEPPATLLGDNPLHGHLSYTLSNELAVPRQKGYSRTTAGAPSRAPADGREISPSPPFCITYSRAWRKQTKKAVLGSAGKQPNLKRSFPRLLDGRKLLSRPDDHEMNPEAHPFISRTENELAERRMVGHGRMEGWDWKNCSLGRGWSCGAGGREQAAQKKFSPGGAAGGSVEGPPRFAEENFLDGSSSGRGREEFISRPE